MTLINHSTHFLGNYNQQISDRHLETGMPVFLAYERNVVYCLILKLRTNEGTVCCCFYVYARRFVLVEMHQNLSRYNVLLRIRGLFVIMIGTEKQFTSNF